MSSRTVLHLARPTTLQVILDSIVSRTNTKQGTDLPPVTTLRPVVAEETDLPVFAEAPPEGKVGFVYCAGQYPHAPPGEPLVIVCFRPLPGFGREEDGMFSGAIVVYAWQHPGYPLTPKEVEWSIAHDCGCEHHEWSEVSVCWEKLNAMAHDDLQDLAAQYAADLATSSRALVNQPSAAPGSDKAKKKRKAAVSHRGSGQPRKPATIHLMNLMRTLPSDRLYDFKPFFPSWLHVYEEKEGRTPPCPEDLFRQTAHSCAERILRERGVN